MCACEYVLVEINYIGGVTNLPLIFDSMILRGNRYEGLQCARTVLRALYAPSFNPPNSPGISPNCCMKNLKLGETK